VLTLDAFQGFIVGWCLGLLAGVLLGRWSLLLLMRKSWRAQQLRQLGAAGGRDSNPQTVPFSPAAGRPRQHLILRAGHAGQYVEHERTRPYVGQLKPPGWFPRVR
jgi:hypothetical protein